jgi:PKHD-type hydroxylase
MTKKIYTKPLFNLYDWDYINNIRLFEHSTKHDPWITSTIPGSTVPPANDYLGGARPSQAEYHPVKSFEYSNPELVPSPFDSYEFARPWILKEEQFTQYKPWNERYTTRTSREVAEQDRLETVKPYSVDWSFRNANKLFESGCGPREYSFGHDNTWFRAAVTRIDSAWDNSTLTRSLEDTTAFSLLKPRIDLKGPYTTSYGVRPAQLASDATANTTTANTTDSSPWDKPWRLDTDRYIIGGDQATATANASTSPEPTLIKPAMRMPACTSCGHVAESSEPLAVMSRVWAALDGFLSPEECDSLQALISGSVAPARVSLLEQGRVNPEIRISDVGWINGSADSAWLYNRLWDAVSQANNTMFFYDLQYLEPLQYTVYKGEQEGYYGPHYDWGSGQSSMRKLSFTVQLSDTFEYSGGDLLLYSGEPEPIPAPRAKGTITVFPSWMLHEVTPVVQGVRKSLVGWFSGPVHF